MIRVLDVTPPCMRANPAQPGGSGLAYTGANGTTLTVLAAAGLLTAGAAAVYFTRRRGIRE